jgi:prepilin-type N-terminal cleavage/methylation domain-containing protein
MKNRKTGYTLVEIMIVVILMSIIIIVGFRAMRSMSSDAVQLSRAAANSRKAQFDMFEQVLNDRLGQAWSYTLTPTNNGSTLNLFDSNGTNYAEFTLTSPDNLTFTYAFADLTTNYTANPLALTYVYTNQEPANFLMHLVVNNVTLNFTNTVVSWQIPPPLYFDAVSNAFIGVISPEDPNNFASELAMHQTNHTGLLQHDLRTYNWNPRAQAIR